MALYDGLTPTIYAAPANVGTGSGANEANAMALTSAVAAAGLGTVIGLASARGASSYFFTTANTNAVFWAPPVSGTLGSPIRIVAKYPALDYPDNPELWSEFRATAPVLGPDITALNGNRPAFGADPSGSSHVHWIGGYMDTQYTGVRPSHGVFYAGDGTVGIKMLKWRVDVYAYYGSDFDDDNPVVLFGSGSDDFEIANNIFSGGGHTPADVSEFVNHNVATLMFYGCHNFNVHNNTFSDSNCSIFVKGTTSGGTRFSYGNIRYNWFEDAMLSAMEFADLDAVETTNVDHNVLVRIGLVPTSIGGETDAISLDRSSQNARNLVIDHNTIVNPGYLSGNNGNGIHVKQDAGNYQNLTVTNNVTYFATGLGRRAFMFGWFGGPIAATDVDSDYNIWYGVDDVVNFEQNGTSYAGIPAWNVATALDAHSSNINPAFADILTDDYHRYGADSGSSTGSRRGAYVTNDELIGAIPNAVADRDGVIGPGVEGTGVTGTGVDGTGVEG